MSPSVLCMHSTPLKLATIQGSWLQWCAMHVQKLCAVQSTQGGASVTPEKWAELNGCLHEPHAGELSSQCSSGGKSRCPLLQRKELSSAQMSDLCAGALSLECSSGERGRPPEEVSDSSDTSSPQACHLVQPAPAPPP